MESGKGNIMNNYFFEYYHNETKQSIEKNFAELTQLEKSIGEFFITNKAIRNFSSKKISGLLYVSEASLHRFAKKCGYKGYREFIYSYEKDIENEKNNEINEKQVNYLTNNLKSAYNTLIEENFKLINENQIKRIASLLNSGKRAVMVGSEAESSILEDFKLKFLNLGVDISTVTQNKFLEPRVSALGQGSIIIIFNLSEETEDVRATVRKAKFKGAYLVLITADERQGELYDEVIMTNCTKGMSNMVSRQMVILIIMDVIYTYCSANRLYFETIKDERKEFSSNE